MGPHEIKKLLHKKSPEAGGTAVWEKGLLTATRWAGRQEAT